MESTVIAKKPFTSSNVSREYIKTPNIIKLIRNVNEATNGNYPSRRILANILLLSPFYNSSIEDDIIAIRKVYEEKYRELPPINVLLDYKRLKLSHSTHQMLEDVILEGLETPTEATKGIKNLKLLPTFTLDRDIVSKNSNNFIHFDGITLRAASFSNMLKSLIKSDSSNYSSYFDLDSEGIYIDSNWFFKSPDSNSRYYIDNFSTTSSEVSRFIRKLFEYNAYTSIKPGKIFSFLTNKFLTEQGVNGAVLELLTNHVKKKSEFDSKEFVIVEGDAIYNAYYEKAYSTYNKESSNSNLAKSCMRYDKMCVNTTFDIYAKNGAIVKMLLILSKSSKVKGRALLWYKDGKVYVDRLYYDVESTYVNFMKYVELNGIINISGKNKTLPVHKDTNIEMPNGLEVINTPYMDTYHRIDPSKCAFVHSHSKDKLSHYITSQSTGCNASMNIKSPLVKCEISGQEYDSCYMINAVYKDGKSITCHVENLVDLYSSKAKTLENNPNIVQCFANDKNIPVYDFKDNVEFVEYESKHIIKKFISTAEDGTKMHKNSTSLYNAYKVFNITKVEDLIGKELYVKENAKDLSDGLWYDELDSTVNTKVTILELLDGEPIVITNKGVFNLDCLQITK